MEQVISKLNSWDPQENKSLHGHTGPVWSVKSTSSDDFLFSGSEDQNIIIWDLESEQNIGTLAGHSNTVNALELCLNESVLVSGDWNGNIIVWDWRSQVQLGNLIGHTAGVYVFLTTKDESTLVSGSGDYTARIWNVETRVLLATLNNSPNSIFALALLPDQKTLVTGGWNGVIRVWDFNNYTQISEHQSSNEVVQCMAITPNSQYLIFGTRGNKVKVWVWSTKAEYMSFDLHNNWVRNMVVTSDSKYFISASADKTIRMVNIEEKFQEFNFDRNDGYIFGLHLSKDGSKLYSGASDKIVRIREIGSVRKVRTLAGHARCIMSISFAKNGEFLVTGSEDSTVRKWSTESFTQVFSTNFHSNTVWAVYVTDDSRRILSVGGDHKVIVMDSDGNLIKRMNGHTHPVFCVAGSADNAMAASGAQDKNVILWDLEGLKYMKILEGHTDTVFSVKFCENDSKVVSGSADYTVRVWFTKPIGLMTVIRIQGGMIESVAISSDLKYMAIGDRKNNVHLWDWANLRHIITFTTHTKWVKCVCFSSDSKTIISCSNDLTIRMWKINDLCLDYTCYGHKSTIRCVAQSPDNKYIASVSEDLSIKLWPTETEDFLGIVDFLGMYDDFLFKNSILSDKFPKKTCFYSFSRLKVNVLHVYCYMGKSDLLLEGLKAGVEIKRDKDNNSPLFYALQRNKIECIEVFIGYILDKKYSDKVEVLETCKFLSNDFHLLVRYSSKSLKALFHEMFPIVTDDSLSCSAYSNEELPTYRLSLNEKIDLKKFNLKENQMINPPIQFRSTRFALNLSEGSNESAALMGNLCQNNSKKILDSELVQALYDIKVNQVKGLFYAQMVFLGLCFLIASLNISQLFNLAFVPFVLFACFKLRCCQDFILYALASFLYVNCLPMAAIFGACAILIYNELIKTKNYKILGICIKKVSSRLLPVFIFTGYAKMALIGFENYVVLYYNSELLQFDLTYSGIGLYFASLVIEVIVVGTNKKLSEKVWVRAFQESLKNILVTEKIMKRRRKRDLKYFVQSCSYYTKSKKLKSIRKENNQ